MQDWVSSICNIQERDVFNSNSGHVNWTGEQENRTAAEHVRTLEIDEKPAKG